MAEDFMAAVVKRVEEQFAKSGVSESCAAFERKDSQIEMRDGVKLHTIYYFPREARIRRKQEISRHPDSYLLSGKRPYSPCLRRGTGAQRLCVCLPVLPRQRAVGRKMGAKHQ